MCTCVCMYTHYVLHGSKETREQRMQWMRRHLQLQLPARKLHTISTNKHTYGFAYSDTHVEVDMTNVTREMWIELYDVFAPMRRAYIVCTQVHHMTGDLWDMLPRYIHRCSSSSVCFVLLTDHLSFLPVSLHRGRTLAFSCPVAPSVGLEPLVRVWYAWLLSSCSSVSNVHKLRNALYDICVYHVCVEDAVWQLWYEPITTNALVSSTISLVWQRTMELFQQLSHPRCTHRVLYLESWSLFVHAHTVCNVT